ncbi:hypothetical protein CRUP_024789 [Coryphaenoides rupestris]|nr:hypothetical protein CRUP_024789 [Coryphaenoides rupestris]
MLRRTVFGPISSLHISRDGVAGPLPVDHDRLPMNEVLCWVSEDLGIPDDGAGLDLRACTMAMEGWKVTSIGGMGGSSIIKVAWYWSSLWRACFTDSTAVTNCYDFPVLWSVDGG